MTEEIKSAHCPKCGQHVPLTYCKRKLAGHVVSWKQILPGVWLPVKCKMSYKPPFDVQSKKRKNPPQFL